MNEAYVGKDNGVTTFQKKSNYTITARKAGCTDTSVALDVGLMGQKDSRVTGDLLTDVAD